MEIPNLGNTQRSSTTESTKNPMNQSHSLITASILFRYILNDLNLLNGLNSLKIGFQNILLQHAVRVEE